MNKITPENVRQIDGTNAFTCGEVGAYRIDNIHAPILYISIMTNNSYTPATLPAAWRRYDAFLLGR